MFGLARPQADAARMETKEFIELTIGALMPRPESPRISDLSFDDANRVIKALGGEPFTAYGKSRRTINYRKQAAGVKSIETDAQLKLIRNLAAERNMTDSGLEKLATRMHLPWPPNTTEQGNKITEALKAMNKREPKNNVRAFPTGTQAPSPATADPKFRRVA